MTVEFPEVFVFDETDDEADAATELARQIDARDIEAPFVVSSVHGRKLSADLAGPRPPERHDPGADQDAAAELGSRAKGSGADAIVAVGGGRCLDIAKLAAARAGLMMVAVPTQLSHDGICSPVAVVPGADGRPESIGAVAPFFVFVSQPTLVTAPVESLAAGLGDLLANPLALRDWALAAERGLEEIDQRAWDLSVESFERIEPSLDTDPRVSANDPAFYRSLCDALILSGMAMICSGTSRPASGGEHEISHAIDELHGGLAHHGAQVAFGCILSVALYGDDTEVFRTRLRKLGLPENPRDLGLSERQTVEVLLHAPQTRPGRFTIIEDADLDEGRARKLVREIWPE
ncbi:MAG TPA: iron-containing alcohol dehydrogenase [Actinomycetota bacterium]|nr:iron-containing alcohol dehydrogenase [Actinomycetota bacterium]